MGTQVVLSQDECEVLNAVAQGMQRASLTPRLRPVFDTLVRLQMLEPVYELSEQGLCAVEQYTLRDGEWVAIAMLSE